MAGANTVNPAGTDFYQGYYYSSNGGTIWTGSDILLGTSNRSWDPAVAFDAAGNAYFHYIDNYVPYVKKSTDGGATWQSSVAIPNIGSPDKGHMAVEENNIYVSLTDFASFPGSPVVISRSTDGGASFSNPINISGGVTSHFSMGVNLATGSNNEVYAVWAIADDWDDGVYGSDGIGFNMSLDGGATWQSPQRIFNIDGSRDWWYDKNDSSKAVRMNDFPCIAVDRSGGERDGTIYMVWGAKGQAPDRADIHFSKSTDGGDSWSTPVRVNNDNTSNDQWFPWITVNPHGVINIVFYDSRNDQNNQLTEVWVAQSANGGQTFTNFRVSDVASTPYPIEGQNVAYAYMGDYIGITSKLGKAYASWMDNRTGTYQAYVDIIDNTVSGTIASNTTWSGYKLITGDVTVNSGVTLTIEPGTFVFFESGTKLRIYGTLYAEGSASNNITFTRSGTSGSWYGIRFENSSVDADCIIKYANIEYATYGIYAYRANPTIEYNNISNTTRGVYCRYADPTIRNNTISYSDYGIYLYQSSPDIKTNLIEHSTRGIWANGSDYWLTIRDNRIVGDEISDPGGTMVDGTYFYNCFEPYFYSNTITGCAVFGLHAEHYSTPRSTGLDNNNLDGLNRVVLQGECDFLSTIYAHDHSDPFLGSSISYGGKNAIYMEIEGGIITAEVVAQQYSDIVAQQNWWGKAPPTGFHKDGTSSIDYSDWLTSDPGGGSSLGKTMASSVDSSGLYMPPDPPDTNSAASLWAWGTYWWLARNWEQASHIYKILTRRFSHLPEAHIALVRVASAYRQMHAPGLNGYLHSLVNGSIDEELKTAALELVVSTYLRQAAVSHAVETAQLIVARAPDTEHEYKALFNLFNMYHKDLEDDEKATETLDLLKLKYPDYELTQIAQSDMEEEVDWSVARRFGGTTAPLIKTASVPLEYSLAANFPNPFNPNTTIMYGLPEDAHVRLVVYDILGREVIRLVDRLVPAGYHQVVWNGKDLTARPMASGVYIYSIQANRFKQSGKMLLVR